VLFIICSSEGIVTKIKKEIKFYPPIAFHPIIKMQENLTKLVVVGDGAVGKHF
jgi:hypothetical protein